MSSVRERWHALVTRLRAPVSAVPLDVFRVLVGLVAIGYFARCLHDLQLYVSNEGVIDHQLSEEMFWFSAQPLFRPSMSDGAMAGWYAVGCAACVLVVAGIAPRVMALVAYVIAVCSYRWCFLVMSVDDAIVHWLLLWLVLLPIGHSLRFCFRERRFRPSWDACVSGTALRLLSANVALIYFVAGTSKWASPLWREGHALFAVLKMPGGWWANDWSLLQAPWLRPLSLLALLCEPLFVLLVFLAPGRVKNTIAAAAVSFHLFILATMDVVFANLGCLAAFVLVYHREIAERIRDTSGRRRSRPPAAAARWAETGAAILVAMLAGAMTCSMAEPNWRASEGAHRAAGEQGVTRMKGVFFAGLWLAGVAQQYRLLDWIDERNYHLEPLVEHDERPIDPQEWLPHALRSGIVQSYLLGGRWLPIPRHRAAELRASLHLRIAHRHCRRHHGTFDATVAMRVSRIDPRRPMPPRLFELARFACRAGRLERLFVHPLREGG